MLTLRPSGLLGERGRTEPGERIAMTIKTPFVAPLRALVALPCCPGLQLLGNAWVRIATQPCSVMLALGLNIVVGYAGLLDLGYRRLLRGGLYLFRAAGLAAPGPRIVWFLRGHSAMFPTGLHMPLCGRDPAGGRLASITGCWAPRSSCAGATTGHRHAGLRRDHPRVPEQPGSPGQHHQWPLGHQADRQPSRSSGMNLGQPLDLMARWRR